MKHKTLTEWARQYDVHPNTVKRWKHPGVNGVKLACWKKGGRWVANEADVVAFFASLSGKNASVPMSQDSAHSPQKLDRDLGEAGW